MKPKVVVTSGATREPIDSVRFISNLSSGRTGAMIAEALAARGFQVTHLSGVESVQAATPRGARLSPTTPRSTRRSAASRATTPARR
jgi:phosphopantothenoylcysteine decarboxylase/phosphopantothenate--cysteine ligase